MAAITSDDDPIDNLLDQAESYAQSYLTLTNQDDDASASLPPLSLSIPSRHLTTLTSILEGDIMEVKDTVRGKGMYAKRDLEMGQRLVIAKPVTLIMACEVDEEDEDESDSDGDSADEEDGGRQSKEKNIQNTDSESIDPLSHATGTKRNGLILLHTLQSILENPSIWTDTLSHLFPRTTDEVLALPPWICSNASLGMEIESVMNTSLSKSFDDDTARDIQRRLPLIVRYNVLSVETSNELFVYPDAESGGLINLEATGLYGPEVSFFNHSCCPNVSRYCIGDIMFFITNRSVEKGQELCFSYIEHEFLCESSARRTAMLDMDFTDHSDVNHDETNVTQQKSKRQKVTPKQQTRHEEDIPSPLIDVEMQNELMATPALDRLEMITDLLDPNQPLNPNHDDYQSDKYNLRILHAITLENLARSKDALEEWLECLRFCIANYPPIDETTVVIHVRIALCAYSCNEMTIATKHAADALKMHDILFGGGMNRMRKRYKYEFLVKMRREDGCGSEKAEDVFWPCCNK